MTKTRWPMIAAAMLSLLFGCASPSTPLPPPPIHPNGQALWGVIHDHCVPDQRLHRDPSPCALVTLSPDEAHGFVVLKDRDGATQYLVMPTAKITGIEDPAILAAGATNYFAAAWGQRHDIDDRLGQPLDRTQVSIAVNSIYGRSQDQLHLHLDCLDRSVRAALRAAQVGPDGRWTDLPLKNHPYRARWLDDAALATSNPFDLLADSQPGAPQDMGAWTLALVGARRPDGAQGFYLLADRADPAHADPGSAEELQDHACRL